MPAEKWIFAILGVPLAGRLAWVDYYYYYYYYRRTSGIQKEGYIYILPFLFASVIRVSVCPCVRVCVRVSTPPG